MTGSRRPSPPPNPINEPSSAPLTTADVVRLDEVRSNWTWYDEAHLRDTVSFLLGVIFRLQASHNDSETN